MLDPFEFSVLVSNIGDVKSMFLATLLVAGILFFLKKYKESSILIMSTVLATAVTFILKHIFKIPRPDSMLIVETGYRFPSAHATMAGVVVGFYFFVVFGQIKSKFWKAFFAVLVLAWYAAINFSRLFLEVHIFIDVFIGGVIGLVGVWSVVYAYNRYRRSR